MSGDDRCPSFQAAVELIGRRWNGAIARALLPGPLHFSELARAIPEISDRLLSRRLKELEAAGIVARGVEGGPPVRVRYALTEKGAALEEVIAQVERWANAWQPPAAP